MQRSFLLPACSAHRDHLYPLQLWHLAVPLPCPTSAGSTGMSDSCIGDSGGPLVTPSGIQVREQADRTRRTIGMPQLQGSGNFACHSGHGGRQLLVLSGWRGQCI